MVNHVDARDCDALEKRLEDQQCTWDGSWLPDFERDFEQVSAAHHDRVRIWSLEFGVLGLDAGRTRPDVRLQGLADASNSPPKRYAIV